MSYISYSILLLVIAVCNKNKAVKKTVDGKTFVTLGGITIITWIIGLFTDQSPIFAIYGFLGLVFYLMEIRWPDNKLHTQIDGFICSILNEKYKYMGSEVSEFDSKTYHLFINANDAKDECEFDEEYITKYIITI